ncbi:hypothetical protein RIF29_40994 [Crotalaria pallida]|uniref:Hexosyltransferase n=1 Tax=Crotalaria pallida TaxID=3830 RepID=A0AAN9HNZ0_CROPI
MQNSDSGKMLGLHLCMGIFDLKMKILSTCFRSFLHTYAHDDVSTGSWFIGLHVMQIDGRKFCCSVWSPEVCSDSEVRIARVSV